MKVKTHIKAGLSVVAVDVTLPRPDVFCRIPDPFCRIIF